MPTTNEVCAQVWSKANCFRWGLVLLATLGEELPAATSKYAELDFLVPFLCCRLPERLGFGERDEDFHIYQE